MKYNWILDVLADLKTFAHANGLEALAEQLDDTQLIAATEIVSKAERASAQSHGDEAAVGTDTGGIGARARA
jgi:hypothetical protein